MKHIIKNCPNLNTGYYGTGEVIHNECGLDYDQLCKDIPNCLLKRIAELCNKATHEDLIPSCDLFKTANDVSQLYGRANMAKEILQLLDIEECE